MSGGVRLRLPRCLPARVDVHEDEDRATHDEEAEHREHRVPALTGRIDHRGKDERTEDAGVAFEHAEEREELRRLVARNQTARPAKTAVLAPMRPATMPKTKAKGTPMNCVMSSAVIIAFWSMPIWLPNVVAILMMVWMPSL